MDLHSLLKGLVIGFVVAAPVGPIGVLCIQRTFAYGKWYGFVSGLGAATADACYGLLAGLGLTVITGFLLEQQFWIELIGGCFLVYLGMQILRSQPTVGEQLNPLRGLLTAYTSIFFLTLTNPLTILSFMGIFAGVGFASPMSLHATVLLVLGVFIGSALWWLMLSFGTSLLRQKLNLTSMVWINRLSGIIVLTFAIGVFYRFLFDG